MNNETINKFSIQTSFAISAGAGSGKTYTLSRRFINILLGFDFFIENPKQEHFYGDHEAKKADLREIVTITYTEAAALEMKERIFGLIHKILHVDTLDEKDGDLQSIRLAYETLDKDAAGYIHERLNKAMKEMGEATITTIHGFCLGVLKRHADVAKIDGALEVYGDEDKQQLFQKVYFEIINDDAYQNDILTITKNVSLNKSIALIERYVFEHKFRQALDHYFHGNSDKIKEILVNIFLESLSDLIDEAREELKSDPKLPALERFLKKAFAFEVESFNESAESLGVSKTLGAKKYPATTEVRDCIQGLWGYFCTVDAEKEDSFAQIIESFRKLLGLIKSRYDEELRKVGVTDFDTIIQRAASIMDKIDTGYRYIMVDEFQDTNAIQWDIVKSGGKNVNLFVVGDEKQSIYS
ncbi:MAG: UvrD-helicase domain-containing protein, partial [Sulfuricurvum sp.]